MHAFRNLLAAIAILAALPHALAGGTDGPASADKTLLDLTPGNPGLAKCLAPSCAQVTADLSKDAAAPGLVVTIQPGKDNYPGLAIKPDGGASWDLSAYGHVEIRVTNLGASCRSQLEAPGRQCGRLEGRTLEHRAEVTPPSREKPGQL